MKAVFMWSGGKDSSLALHSMKCEGMQPDLLLSTTSAASGRVTMHGIDPVLISCQGESLNIPVRFMELKDDSHVHYEDVFRGQAYELREEGFTHMIFGDIFLQDLREYRDSLLSGTGINSVYPLWKKDTRELASHFVNKGFRAIVCAAAIRAGEESLCGKELNRDFFRQLPEGIDPCGENGEYHTFCYDGPIFSRPVKFEKGDKVIKSYGKFGDFEFLDLNLAEKIRRGFCLPLLYR